MSDLDQWHKLKRYLDFKNTNKHFREREIFYCYLGKNLGHEQDGKGHKFLRPVIVFKKFNNHLFLGIPTTTKQKKK